MNNPLSISPEIFEIIKTTNKILKKFDAIEGAVLGGSSSRNEESYLFPVHNGHRKLLSDFEFVVFIKSSPNRSQKLESYIAQEIIKETNYFKTIHNTPFFQIDVSFLQISKLKHLDKRFFNFEMKCCGKQFYGQKDILSLYPEVTLHNLNWAELQTVLIHRLFKVNRILRNEDDFYKAYCIARNMLDILTVLLPYEGLLIPTYEARLIAFKKVSRRGSITKHFETNSLLKDLDFCMAIKKNPTVLENPSEIFPNLLFSFLKHLFCLHDYIRDKQKGPVFQWDRRGILRHLIHFSFRKLILEMKKPFLLETLFEEMLNDTKINKTKEYPLYRIVF